MSRVVRDWKCPKCGHRLVDIPDSWLVSTGPLVCPNDGEKLEKVWSAPTAVFKGDGWTPTFHKPGER